MKAFERINSGIPGLDKILDHIRLGDNVVFQVSELKGFRLFAEAFARQMIAEGRNMIYVRFSDHEPILEPMEGLRIIPVELSHRFETFTINVHNLIEKEGREAFYVFDCLSELEEAWATDLMMGNFFHLTCPYLFSLDTVAYFPVLRGRHSFAAIEQIRNTTQILLDTLPSGVKNSMFVRPIKVWERSSETMFHPHLFDLESGQFHPLKEGVEVSHFYRQMDEHSRRTANQNMDSWERFFQLTEMKYQSGLDVTEECGRICDIMLTRDPRIRELIKRNFGPEDYFAIHDRMVGTGMIGGKACGMLLARKLTENLRPDIYARIEPHDSFYIGSDVFYAYIVENGFWDLKIRQKTEEGYFSLAETIAEEIMVGDFSPAMEAEFRKILEYYGSAPIIVRSSSILEDGFGNAFAGKYESVFCGSEGPLEERLVEFEKAIRTVYASTMGMSALDYRKRRGLEDLDEQMSILVQRVSGSHHVGFLAPTAAGVGYSISPYRMGVEHPEEGMLRLVAGLGTAAVDRQADSYPRIVSLDAPLKTMYTTDSDRHQYSQRLIDGIGSGPEPLQRFPAEKICEMLPSYLIRALYSHDRDAERDFQDRGFRESIYYVSCEGLVRSEALMEDMKALLHLLHEAYDYPVDIEFTINLSPKGEYMIGLLQCRPLQLTQEGDPVSVPDPAEDATVYLETRGVSMGFSRKFAVDRIVYIDAIAYYQMPYRDKFKVRDALSAINWACREQHKHLVLITPGRICTSSPELGVPSVFSDISEFDAIVEVSESRAGYIPELSYGSHIFQDLVEAGILYSAVFEGDSTLCFSPEDLKLERNRLGDYCENWEELKDIIHVAHVCHKRVTLYYDMATEHLLLMKRPPAVKKA